MYLLISFTNFLLLIIVHIYADLHSQSKIFYPTLWETAPSSLADYPLVNDSTSQYRLIDPWFYPHRLGLYKILINVTTPLMPFCSSSNVSNILFALPSQLSWLFNSNRLFTNGTLNMSLDSWWAAANYYVSAIPFLAAVDVGIIPQESFRIRNYENFCSNSIECLHQAPKAMKQWRKFFTHLKQINTNTNEIMIDSKTIDNLYLGPMWLAFKKSMEDALSLTKSKTALLPSNFEQIFSQGWARLLNLIAMTRKNTNLYEAIRNQHAFLPHRLLLDTDRNSTANGLPESVNRSLEFIVGFRYDWLNYIEGIWSKLTCNYESRIYAQHTLEAMAISKMLTLKYLTQALINSFLFRCDPVFKNDL